MILHILYNIFIHDSFIFTFIYLFIIMLFLDMFHLGFFFYPIFFMPSPDVQFQGTWSHMSNVCDFSLRARK